MGLILTDRAALATLCAIVALLILILRFRMNAFIALILVATIAAVGAGMPPEEAYATLTNGVGSTLGFIAPVIGLGAIFGAILNETGGVASLTTQVARTGGPQRQAAFVALLGLIASTPVFFDVALIILLPFVVTLAKHAERPAMYFGLPLCAGLAVGHAFIPPTPGPIAIAALVGADLGWVILFGSIAGLVSVLVAGPLFVSLLTRLNGLPRGAPVLTPSTTAAPTTVSFRTATLLMALPLALIVLATVSDSLLPQGLAADAIALIGHPFGALIIASGAALAVLRPRTKEGRDRLHQALSRALEPTGAVILVTGAGGAFKQVLVDTGAGATLAAAVLSAGFTPLIAGFCLALLVRVAQGSATVAMITAGGLMAPIVELAEPSAPQLGLLTIAIAAGATACSHVNDSGFWLVNKLFGLSEAETLRTWTVATSLISLTGLAVTCLISLFV